MVRSTAISWKIGLAVFAAVLPFWQLPALADDGKADKVEPRPQPVEAKSVRIILQPAANDAVFALRPPRPATAAGTVSTRPADDAAVAPPQPEPAKLEEDAAFDEPPSLSEQSPQIALQPPAGDAALAQPRSEPVKLKEDALVVASPSVSERSPQIALQPPASNAASVRSRPDPAKIRKDAALAPIPSLPERRPFRPVLANIEPAEKEQNAALASQKQAPEPASFLAKVNSAFKPLTNLWPGNKQASEAVAPTAEASDSSTASPASTDPGPASDKTDAKQEQGSFLKSLRFW